MKEIPESRQISKVDSDINSVENNFSKIKNSTYCPFADKSNIQYFESWNRYKTFDENLVALVEELIAFTHKCEEEKMDGFIFEVSGDNSPMNLQDLSSLLKRVLLKLNELDPKKDDCMSKDISAPGWQFVFNGQRIFMITFGSFYSEDSPRYSMNKDSTFIFMQPESSFHLHIINPAKSPQTLKLKEKIRSAFVEGGKPYNTEIVDSPSDAIKYIKPLHKNDSHIEWWK
jgi:hypothetical protein